MTEMRPLQGKWAKRLGLAVVALGAVLAWTASGNRPAVIQPVAAQPSPPDHSVSVLFDAKSCPTGIDPGASACFPGGGRCIRARVGHRIVFSSPQPTPGTPRSEFQLQLGPTRDGLVISQGGTLAIQIMVDVTAGSSKVFPFNVLKPGCPPVDPQIIVDN